MKKLIGSLAACVALFVSARAADDITVAFGESRTLESGTYGVVTVNGTLTVADGAVISCTSLLIGVKGDDNGAENCAVYTQGAGSQVTVTSTTSGDLKIGNGTRATVTLNANAELTSSCESYIGLGNATGVETPIHIVLNNATFYAKGLVTCSTSASGSNAEIVIIELNGTEAALRPRQFCVGEKKESVRIRFNGGRYVADEYFKSGRSEGAFRVSSQNDKLYLESVNGQPIRLECWKNTGIVALFQPSTYSDRYIETQGAGELVLERANDLPLVKSGDYAQGVCFNHTGGIRLMGGAELKLDTLAATVLANMTVPPTVRVGVGSKLDLNGTDLTAGSVETVGSVVNSVAGTTPTLTLGGNGADSVFSAPPDDNLRIVKTGSGRLMMPEGQLGEIMVEEGLVDFCDRSSVGFPYWRFKVTVPPANKTFRICEFAVSNGTSDVRNDLTAVSYSIAGGWTGEDGSPSHLFDDDLTTYWYDRAFASGSTDDLSNRVFFVMHFGGAPKFTFEDFVDPEFKKDSVTKYEPYASESTSPALNGIIDRYAFYTDDNDWFKRLSPETFVLQGSLTGNDWRTIDAVKDYTDVSCTPHVWSKLFEVPPYGKSPVSVGTFELADNAEWVIDFNQAQVAATTFKAGRNVKVRLLNCGKPSGVKALPVTIGTCINPENLSSWQLFYDDKAEPLRGVSFADGTIRVSGPGLLMIFR